MRIEQWQALRSKFSMTSSSATRKVKKKNRKFSLAEHFRCAASTRSAACDDCPPSYGGLITKCDEHQIELCEQRRRRSFFIFFCNAYARAYIASTHPVAAYSAHCLLTCCRIDAVANAHARVKNIYDTRFRYGRGRSIHSHMPPQATQLRSRDTHASNTSSAATTASPNEAHSAVQNTKRNHLRRSMNDTGIKIASKLNRIKFWHCVWLVIVGCCLLHMNA